MKVIEQSAVIMPYHPVCKTLELAGRIAYRSEEKIKPGSDALFIDRIIKNKHMPVLDLASVYVSFQADEDYMDMIRRMQKWGKNKYIRASFIQGGYCLLSGSPRAFIEYLWTYRDAVSSVYANIAHALVTLDNVVFGKLENLAITHTDQYIASDNPEFVYNWIKLTMKNYSSDERFQEYIQHVGLSVQFITNRAVTHEMVRHRPCGFLQESQRYCRYSEDKFGNEVTFINPSAFNFDEEEYASWKDAMLITEQLYLKLLKTATPQAARLVLPNSCKTSIIVHCPLRQWFHMFDLRTSKEADPSMRQLMTPVKDIVVASLMTKFPTWTGVFPERYVEVL